MTDFLKIYNEKYGDKSQTKLGAILTDFLKQFNEKFSVTKNRTGGVGAYFIVSSNYNKFTYKLFFEAGNTRYKFLEIVNPIDKDIDVKSITVFQNNKVELVFEDTNTCCSVSKFESMLIDIIGYDRTITLINNLKLLSKYS